MPAKFKITDNSLKKFSKAVANAIEDKINSPKARAALSRELKPFMEEQIEKAIAGESLTGNTSLCNSFRPDRQGIDVVGALGIGVGGSTSPEKYTRGWKDLLPGKGRDKEGSPAAKVTISFAKNTFGKVTYNLDVDKFYDSKINTYVAQTNGKRIQWMRQFIEGFEVLTHEYVEIDDNIPENLKEKIIEDSRTGLGIMVKFNLDELTPFILSPQPNPFPKIGTAIKRRLSSQNFRKDFREVIRRVLNA